VNPREITFRSWRLLPDRLRVPLDILRRCPRWREAGVIFVHVPKAAGVSFSRALYGRPLGHFQARDIRRVCPETFTSLVTFGVVRHPVDRLYSAYRFVRTGGTTEMGMKNPGIYLTEVFSSFDRFVGEWLVKQDLANIDGVFRPQHLYLCDGEEIIVDQVIPLEQISVGMNTLSARLGREIVLGHHNKSVERPLVIESAGTLSIIRELYQKDFEIFSYPPEMSA
jgi:hypothetical protein